jgi:putative flippase GtrA
MTITVAGRWQRFVRFNLVGALGIGVQLGVLRFLLTSVRAPIVVGTIVAVFAAIVHNFVWHLHWTWRDRPLHRTGLLAAFTRFVVANGAISLAGNVVIMTIFAAGMGLPPLVANVIAIGVCGVVNFWVGDVFVFAHTEMTEGTGVSRLSAPSTDRLAMRATLESGPR